jgi:DNA-binding transcriptional LysR family regulator
MQEWSDYAVALAIHEEGSHERAARALNSSQPTVSRRFRALEARLGGPLFQRSGGVLNPTALGELVLARARSMREDAADIERAAGAEQDRISGQVRIASSEGVGADWLPRALAPLLAQHPDLEIELKLDLTTANIAAGDADIALRWRGPGDQQSLIARKATSVGAGLYAATAYLDRAGRPRTVEELRSHEAVDWSLGSLFVWPGGEAPIQPERTRISMTSPAAYLAALSSGLGIGVTTHRLARAAWLGLERVLPDYDIRLDLWLVGHEGLRANRAHGAVFDYLAGAVQADKAHFTAGEASAFGRFY